MRLAASRAVLHYYRAYLHPNSAFLPLTLEGAFARTSIRRVTTRTHAVLSPPILRGCTRRKICSNGDGLFTYAHRSEPTYAFEPISQNQAMYHSVLNPSPLIRCLPFGSEEASPSEEHLLKCRHPIYVAQETTDYSFNRLSEMPAIPLGLSPSFLSAFCDDGDCGEVCPHHYGTRLFTAPAEELFLLLHFHILKILDKELSFLYGARRVPSQRGSGVGRNITHRNPFTEGHEIDFGHEKSTPWEQSAKADERVQITAAPPSPLGR